MKANALKSATGPYPRKSEGTTRRRTNTAPESAARQSKMKARQQRRARSPRMPTMPLGPDSRTVLEQEVPMPGALNPLATPTDSGTLKEVRQFVPSDPSIAQHHGEVAIINLGPKAEDGTDWLDVFPSERDRVPSLSTCDLVPSPQPFTRSARDPRQDSPRGSFGFVPIPPALLWDERPPIRAAVHNVAKATRVGIEVIRLALELLTKAIGRQLTSGSQVSRRAHRVAIAAAIATALATTFIHVLPLSVRSMPVGNTPREHQPTATSNDAAASILNLVPSLRISGAGGLVPARDPSSNVSIEARRWGIGTHGSALRRVRLASAALHAGQKRARSRMKILATRRPLVEPSSGPPFTGGLVVTSDPDGAEVSINGVLHGRTPLVIQPLPAGNRIVRLDLPGYDRWSWSVGVVANKRTSVSVTLRPETGRLESPYHSPVDGAPLRK